MEETQNGVNPVVESAIDPALNGLSSLNNENTMAGGDAVQNPFDQV